jgi:hypothetical protein
VRTKPSLWYEARVSLGLTALLPVMGLPAFAVLSRLLAWDSGYAMSVEEAVRAFEIILPLCAGIGAAHLMSVERDAGIDELRRTYAEAQWRLPLVRTLSGLLIIAASVLFGLTSFYAAFGIFPMTEVVAASLPPALFVMSLSLMANHLSGSYWVGAGVVMGYWFMEIMTRGQVTGSLFLFALTWPVRVPSYDLNRFLLVIIGLLLMAFNAWIYARRPGWRHSRRDALADG